MAESAEGTPSTNHNTTVKLMCRPNIILFESATTENGTPRNSEQAPTPTMAKNIWSTMWHTQEFSTVRPVGENGALGTVPEGPVSDWSSNGSSSSSSYEATPKNL